MLEKTETILKEADVEVCMWGIKLVDFFKLYFLSFWCVKYGTKSSRWRRERLYESQIIVL
jgi:hypothetical protein